MNFEPHDYQAYAIDYIETHPVAAVLLDMGLGKTVISLTAIACSTALRPIVFWWSRPSAWPAIPGLRKSKNGRTYKT